jgi:phage terminase small subunit
MKDGLTPKQEKFIHAYLETGNASEAYRLSYNVGKMKDSTVNRNAFALLQNDKIATRIDQLRAESAKIAVLTQASVISDLIRVKDHAMTLDDKGMMIKPDIAVRALELLGKNVQAWAPETQVAIQINEGRESFEQILSRAIVIRGGLPDDDARIAQDIGKLYLAWQDGKELPDQ